MSKELFREFCFSFFFRSYSFLLGIFWSIDISDIMMLSFLYLDLNKGLNSVSGSVFFPYTFFHFIHIIFISFIILIWKSCMDIHFLFYNSSFNYPFISFYLIGNLLDISWFSLVWFMILFLKLFN